MYLHNNQLSNAGLPPDAFRGSEAVATLSLSSNRLSYVPPSLPPSLERLHLQVPLLHPPSPHSHPLWAPYPSLLGNPRPPWNPSSQNCVSFSLFHWHRSLTSPLSNLTQASSLSLTQEPSWAPFASVLDPQSHSLLPSQNNIISKVPRGALSRQTHLRELYLQHNQLTDSGLDATTFRWGLGQRVQGCSLMPAVRAEVHTPGAPALQPPPLYGLPWRVPTRYQAEPSIWQHPGLQPPGPVFFFLSHQWHMEVPRQGVKLEL